MASKYLKAEPEQRLITAMLTRALQDVYDTRANVNSRSWFFDDSMEPFTFLWSLQTIGMEHLAPVIRNKISNTEPFNVGFKSKSHAGKKKPKYDWYTRTEDTPLKECEKCHRILPETDFYMKNQLYRWGFCKDCHLEYMRARKKLAQAKVSPFGKPQSHQPERHLPQ